MIKNNRENVSGLCIHIHKSNAQINIGKELNREIEIEITRQINIVSGSRHILLLLTCGLLLDLKESPSPQKCVHFARYMDISGKGIYIVH